MVLGCLEIIALIIGPFLLRGLFPDTYQRKAKWFDVFFDGMFKWISTNNVHNPAIDQLLDWMETQNASSSVSLEVIRSKYEES